MMVFSGNANRALAEKIANQLRIPLGKSSVAEFSDSETAVEILENVRGRDIFLIQSTCHPSNHNLMEMLIMVCLLYTSPSPRDGLLSRMPSSA